MFFEKVYFFIKKNHFLVKNYQKTYNKYKNAIENNGI